MIEINDVVNYHSMIGGEVTSTGHTVTAIQYAPNNYGCDVAWITNHSGCVSLNALSNKDNPPFTPPPKLTRSQQKYRDWQNSECSIDFGECFGECKKCREDYEYEVSMRKNKDSFLTY